jgi:hypothetical protein
VADGFDQTFRHDSGCAFVGQKHHPFAGRSIPHVELLEMRLQEKPQPVNLREPKPPSSA